MLIALGLLHFAVFFTFAGLWVFLASFFVVMLRWAIARGRSDNPGCFGLGL